MITIDDIACPNFIHMGHHDSDYEPQFQIGAFAGRIQVENGDPGIELETYGRLKEGLLWDTVDQAALTRFWSYGHPGYGRSNSIRPVKGPTWSDTEPRLEPITDAAIPGDQDFPDGWGFYVDSALEYDDKPARMALPGFLGLVDPHFEGTEKLGTPVFDVEPGGIRSARLQSLMRVYKYPGDGCLRWSGSDSDHGLALQLGRGRDGMPGHLVFAEANDKITTSPAQILAVGSRLGGGPYHAGGGDCPHIHGKNADGESIYALHWQTGTLFRGGIGDGPLNFGEFYDQNVFDAPFVVKSHLRWNPEKPHNWTCGAAIGRWDFQSESHFQKILPPRKPLPPKDGVPPDPLEPADTDGPFPLTPPLDGFGFPIPVEEIANNPNDQTPRALYGSSLEMAFPCIVGRPQNFASSPLIGDLRNKEDQLTFEEYNQWINSPAVYREECFGVFLDADQWSLTAKDESSRYQHFGTGPGGRVFMPAELGLEFWDQDISGLSLSSTCQFFWESCIAFGAPVIQGVNAGSVIQGWTLSKTVNGFEILATDPAGASVDGQAWTIFEGGDLTHQANNGVISCVNTSGGNPAVLKLGSSNGTIAVPTNSADADILGKVQFNAYNSFSREVGSVRAVVEDIAASAFGLEFHTTDASVDKIAGSFNAAGSLDVYGGISIGRTGGSVGTGIAQTAHAGFVTATIQGTSGTLAYLSDITALTVTASSGVFAGVVGALHLVDTSGGVGTCNLPAASASSGRLIVIKDKGNASSNNITVNRAGSDTIQGATSTAITANYGSVRLRSDGASIWYLVD